MVGSCILNLILLRSGTPPNQKLVLIDIWDENREYLYCVVVLVVIVWRKLVGQEQELERFGVTGLN